MTKRQTTIITALSIISFILALLVSGRYWLRLDLTKTKAHTMSKVSRNLYREIPEPVNITYYLSDKLRTAVPIPGEIEDTLREYTAYSRGKIRLAVRDPVKAELTMMIEQMGIQPRQLPVVEQDQSSIITVYSGIVIEYLDKVDVIPWVLATNTLEYDLTSRIRAMVTDTERQVGVIVGDSFRQWDEDFGYLNMTLASAGYRVRQISAAQEIPDNLPGLIVLGGVEELDEVALYRIDRYIQLGGKVFFAVKGVYIDTMYGSVEARHQEDQGLRAMIASYGIVVRNQLVLDRNARSLQYQTRTQHGGIQIRITRYPLWFGVQEDFANASHPVTAGFSGLDMFWASPLEFLPTDDNIVKETLFTSSPQSWLQTEGFYTSPEIPYLLEMEAADTAGTRILGASLSGIFPSFFSDYPKPMEELPDMPQNGNPSRIIVIGDVDFATNIINATNAAHNLDFLLRAVDWLVSDDEVISIRNRQPQAGRLDKVHDPSRRKAAMSFSQALNVGIVPAFVIVAGLFLASKRRKRSLNNETFNSLSNGASISDTTESVATVAEESVVLTEDQSQEKTDDV